MGMSAANILSKKEKDSELKAVKEAALLRAFVAFKDNLKAIDEPGFNSIRALTLGQAFAVLCSRYSLPDDCIWVLPQEQIHSLILGAASLCGAGTPFVKNEPAPFKKLIAMNDALPQMLNGAKVQVYASSAAGYHVCKITKGDFQEVAGLVIAETICLRDLNSHTRLLDIED